MEKHEEGLNILFEWEKSLPLKGEKFTILDPDEDSPIPLKPRLDTAVTERRHYAIIGIDIDGRSLIAQPPRLLEKYPVEFNIPANVFSVFVVIAPEKTIGINVQRLLTPKIMNAMVDPEIHHEGVFFVYYLFNPGPGS